MAGAPTASILSKTSERLAFRLGMAQLDCIQHRLRVGRASHGLGLFIDAVGDERIVPAMLFEQFDHFRCLLLAQDCQFQSELLAELGSPHGQQELPAEGG